MSESPLSFSSLGLPPALLRALEDIGYESPSPIQAATIPYLMQDRDVLGQAQTGTGKTASFALPVLSRIDLSKSYPQALVLAPTRELAIQVAEAFQSYAKHMPGFHVLPVYGGQSYGPQLSALRRGVHVVVGTPGRMIDHIEKGSLDLSRISTLVLDEADEMLRMGFIDDVERILQETPAERQTALFSATMPAPIRRIAQTYLQDPAEVTIAAKTTTAENIRQRYWLVSGLHKLDALTRILEVEPFDGMIIFTRTKQATEELAQKLDARGFSAMAINGDMNQQQRERAIQLLKDGQIDILVATDVAARGLDVERISHVVNYDVPYDPESYTHRIGRTGRAGRKGEAILFITPRERNLLRAIERATRQPVSPLELPTVQAVNSVRVTRFKEQITETLAQGGLELFSSLIEDYEREHNVPAMEIAAALAKMARGDTPLLLEKQERESRPEREPREPRAGREERGERADRGERMDRGDRNSRQREAMQRAPEPGMQTYRLAVGHRHGVKPGNIVGAIANEANIESRLMGRIDIFDEYSLIDLPDNLPDALIQELKPVKVAGQQLRIRRWTQDGFEQQDQHQERRPRREEAPRESQREFRSSRDEGGQGRMEQVVERALRDAEPPRAPRAEKPARQKPAQTGGVNMQTYRIEVGEADGATPRNIMGAIANEAGLDSSYIGRIELHEHFSTIELPGGMPKDLLNYLKKVWISGKQIKISLADGGSQHEERAQPKRDKKRPK
ncbi:DEAD/DEAH box helicase [Undibacterium squillarum]|uniref:DEAD/DEAH box helicase n=1 Tax=Undibacterium squillarum TaxID=1131567 RepID=UPI0035B45A0A